MESLESPPCKEIIRDLREVLKNISSQDGPQTWELLSPMNCLEFCFGTPGYIDDKEFGGTVNQEMSMGLRLDTSDLES